MKKLNTYLAFCSVLALFFFSACEEKDEFVELTPETEAPAITVLSPEMPVNNEFTPTVGESLAFSIKVSDNEGLSQVFLNGDPIKTYMEEVKDDTITYSLRITDLQVKELIFSVEDGWRNRNSIAKMTIFPVPVVIPEINPDEEPLYVLLDFAGGQLGSEAKVVSAGGDERTLYTFEVDTRHTTTATAEVANSQARLSFAADNPEGEEKVMKIVKVPMEGFGGGQHWSGWPNVIFNLQNPIHEGFIIALPQYDSESSTLEPGKKVIKLDVYYDATVDAAYGWDNVIAATGVWNADPALGYKIDLSLAKYDLHAPGGHDNAGYYISYSAYLTEPNKWVTLTFDMADAGRVGNFGQISADEVDAINIKPAPGYVVDDNNPLYIKNLRIEDVAE